MKDNEVKEKLESLSPLAGGVVFGKEEAWDKLQARLEKKSVRKIPLLRLSAAAIMLLAVSIGGYYHYTQPATTVTGPPVAANATPEIIKPDPQAVTASPETIAAEPETSRVVSTLVTPRQKIAFQVKIADENSIPEPMPQVVDEAPAIANNEQIKKPTPVHKMRVVHINDVGKPEEEIAPVYVYNGPALDLSKMKVVSIYDLKREESMRRQEEDVITIVRINRPHGGLLGFTNAVGWGNLSQRTYAQNPLSIRLNRNN